MRACAKWGWIHRAAQPLGDAFWSSDELQGFSPG